MTLEDKNGEAISNYREHNLKKYYPAENEKQQEDERQENENGNEMNGQKGQSENGNNEKQLEDEGQENISGNKMIVKLMKTTTDDQLENEENIFITQSSFTLNESVQFDIDVNQIFEVGSSPQKEVDIEEQTRPKRQCCGKNRRNSISLF